MKKILLSLMMIALASSSAIGATRAYFSDTETSTGNTFTAGSLDLNVDNGNENVIKFTVANMKPDDQPTGNWTLKNVGTIPGYLDLKNITVTNKENGRTDSEVEAGDTTDSEGELQDLVNVRLYFDNDKDGYYSTGDVMFYNGKVGSIEKSYNLNKVIAPGNSVRINAVLDWWDTANDNRGMTDGMSLDITFDLGQDL